MIDSAHTRSTSVRRLALAGALVASFVPVLIGGSPPAAAAAPTELFMSEYIEGSSFNKAIEIYNGTGAAVDLAAGGYTLELYSNGSATVEPEPRAQRDDRRRRRVRARSPVGGSGDPRGQPTSPTAAVINFNGDDAVVLRKGGIVVDAFGQIGFRPSGEWTGGGADDTLRRKETVCAGDTDASNAFDASVEWNVFPNNTFDGLGAHTTTCDGGGGPGDPVINEFSASTTGSPDVEWIEVLGSPNSDYSTFTLLEIEGDSTKGTIDRTFPVGTTDGAGFWTTAVGNLSIENGTITLLLVEGFTGAAGDDIDADDDGVIDTAPWTRIVDDVAVDDGGAGDLTYSSTVLGPNYDRVSSFAPGGASRFPDGTDTDLARPTGSATTSTSPASPASAVRQPSVKRSTRRAHRTRSSCGRRPASAATPPR